MFRKGNAIDGGDSSSVQDELKDVPWSIWAVYFWIRRPTGNSRATAPQGLETPLSYNVFQQR